MCGINFSFNYFDIKEMNKRINHRGKYNYSTDEYIYDVDLKKKFSLGHVRLPIQGLNEKFACPYIINEEKYLYNGEVYNFKEIGGKESDVEILNKNPIYFDGDFAILKVSKDSKYTTIITDRFGKKQLFYKLEGNKILAISSEIKALANENSGIDQYYSSTIARNGYVFDSNRTIFSDIKRFTPGKEYIINNITREIINKNSINWDSLKLINDNIDNLYDLMELSIKRRLISDIPLGILFSGGLDSTIILHHCIKNENIPKVFIVENNTDIEYAEKYCSENGITPIKIEMKPTEKNIKEAHFAAEFATDLGSVIPKFLLFKEVSKHGINVCLGGTGADEIFGGYKRMKEFDFQYNDIYNELMYYHLPRVDKLSMWNTIEYRTPFTADYVIDYALSIPYKERINKEHLRKIYSEHLPEYIYNRPKEPLKTKEIRENKEGERLKTLELFIKELANDYRK